MKVASSLIFSVSSFDFKIHESVFFFDGIVKKVHSTLFWEKDFACEYQHFLFSLLTDNTDVHIQCTLVNQSLQVSVSMNSVD